MQRDLCVCQDTQLETSSISGVGLGTVDEMMVFVLYFLR